MNLKIPLTIMLCLFSSNMAFAGPYQLSYGGRLAEASGKPVSGPVSLRVSFFRSLAGNDQVAVAIPDFTGVSLQDGLFQVSLNLSAADFHTTFNGTDPTYIQIEDLTHGVIYPRQIFSAVPYALKVPVDGESITFNANGQLALGNGANTLKLPNTAGAANKVLKSDGSGALVWADDLSGGGAGSITSTEIQDGTLTNDDISATAAIANSKIAGLGTAATKNVGTAAGEVAAGDHTHIMSAVTDAGGLATKSAVGSAEITDGSVTGTDIASGTITNANISASAAIDNSKIAGLGNAATKDVGATASDVAAGNHSHGDATTGAAGFMSAADKVRLNAAVVTTDTATVSSTMITDGAIVDADVNASAAITGSKINPNFGAQNVVTTGNVAGGDVSATGYVQTGTSAGAPAAADCDAAGEYGRIKMDTTNNALFVCSSSGWLVVGASAQPPLIRYTRALVAFDATTVAKDTACVAEFGPKYVAAPSLTTCADVRQVVVSSPRRNSPSAQSVFALVSTPAPEAMPSSLDLSAALIKPEAPVVAAE